MKRRMMLVAFLVLALLSLELPTPAQAAAPANDDFDHAEIITSLPYTTSLDTTEATRSDDDPPACWATSPQATVWYAYTAPADLRLKAELTANFDVMLGVLIGTRGSLGVVDCSALMNPLLLDLHVGQTYYFMIGGGDWGGSVNGSATLTLALIPPPPNDEFNNAIAISALPFSDTQDVSAVTRAADDPATCWSYSQGTVWYKITPSANTRVFARITRDYWGGGMTVFTGSRGSLSWLACDSNVLIVDLAVGQTYYFAIDGSEAPNPWTPASMTFSVREVTPPANDDLANAITITALPFTDNRDVTDATTTPDEYGCAYESKVWYAYTPTTNKRIQISLDGSDFDGYVGLFSGVPRIPGEMVCGVDRLRFDAVAGQTYYFSVDVPPSWYGYGESRNLVFTVQEAPPYLAIDLQLDQHGSANPRTKLAIVSGTVQCNQQASLWLTGSVSQQVGRAYIQGYLQTSVECSGPGTVAWSSPIYTNPIPPGGTGKASTSFLAGRVSVAAHISAFNWEWYEYANDSAAGRVTLVSSR
jgi:hypothetical protein